MTNETEDVQEHLTSIKMMISDAGLTNYKYLNKLDVNIYI